MDRPVGISQNRIKQIPYVFIRLLESETDERDGGNDALPRAAGWTRRPRQGSAGGPRRRRAAGGVTAAEAERSRRRGLTPWWQVGSWSKDVDTLTQVHTSLRALDT